MSLDIKLLSLQNSKFSPEMRKIEKEKRCQQILNKKMFKFFLYNELVEKMIDFNKLFSIN